MKLVRADINDCDKIWTMQTKAFSDLLEKYQDYETSPGNEEKERIEAKLSQEFTYFYDLAGFRNVNQKSTVDKKYQQVPHGLFFQDQFTVLLEILTFH